MPLAQHILAEEELARCPIGEESEGSRNRIEYSLSGSWGNSYNWYIDVKPTAPSQLAQRFYGGGPVTLKPRTYGEYSLSGSWGKSYYWHLKPTAPSQLAQRFYGGGPATPKIGTYGNTEVIRRRVWTKILRHSLAIHRQGSVAKKTAVRSLEAEFNELASQWHREIGGESSLTAIVGNINYLRIIALGKNVIPLIIERLKIKPEPWFVALRAITGELNVGKEYSGNFRKIAQAWIEWYSREE